MSLRTTISKDLIGKLSLIVILLCALTSCTEFSQAFNTVDNNTEITTIANHEIMTKLYTQDIPESAIQQAVDDLHIGYGHTSHGSQITSGMSGLVAFANTNFTTYTADLFSWSQDGSTGLHLYEGDGYGDGDLDHDCGYSGWDYETREFLNANPGYNVIMWSWCGQVDSVDIQTHYIDNMEALEEDYIYVTFIYMTGHVEGGSDDPDSNNVLANNNIIRDYCEANGKWLFDFADIEKYNLEGDYFGDKLVNDACDYDSDGDNSRDSNWANDWQGSHTEDVDWYDCGAAHSESVNANQKAYAVWWLFARIAGWDGQ